MKTKYFKIYAYIIGILCLLMAYIWFSNILEIINAIFWIFLPLIVSLIMWKIGNYTKVKHPKLTKFFAGILNILIILIQTLFLFIITVDSWDKEYTDIKDYQFALELYVEEAVQHFPKKVPDGAKNIFFLKTPGGFLGDSSFYLKFDINEEYIKNEQKKYKGKGQNFIIQENKGRESDYNKYRAEQALLEAFRKSNLDSNEIYGYEVKILDGGGCINGFATKGNNIIYLIYCD